MTCTGRTGRYRAGRGFKDLCLNPRPYSGLRLLNVPSSLERGKAHNLIGLRARVLVVGRREENGEAPHDRLVLVHRFPAQALRVSQGVIMYFYMLYSKIRISYFHFYCCYYCHYIITVIMIIIIIMLQFASR